MRDPALSVMAPPNAINRASMSLNMIVAGVGRAKMALSVLCCLVFMLHDIKI